VYLRCKQLPASDKFLLDKGSPPSIRPSGTAACEPGISSRAPPVIHAPQNSSTFIFFPPWNAYAVSHQVHRRLQPVKRHEYATAARARAFALNRLENFRDDHDFGKRQTPAFANLRPLEFAFAPARRDNSKSSEKKNHRDNQPRIAWRNFYKLQDNNVAAAQAAQES